MSWAFVTCITSSIKDLGPAVRHTTGCLFNGGAKEVGHGGGGGGRELDSCVAVDCVDALDLLDFWEEGGLIGL